MIASPVDLEVFAACPSCGRRGCTLEHQGAEGEGDLPADVDRLSLDELEDRIDRDDALSQQRGREAVLAKVRIGHYLTAAKRQRPKGFVAWARDRWGYSQQYGTVLMRLAENHARVRTLLDEEPDLPLRRLAAAIRDELREDEPAEPRTPHVFPVATPADVHLRVLDARSLPADLPGAGAINLVVTSWPYCLGQEQRGYVDFTDYGAWLEAAARWAEQLYRVLGPNGRAVVNLPIDVRKGHDGPRPIAADGLRLLLAAGFQYQSTIVWTKAINGQTSTQHKRGSVCSPNAPCVTTGTELLLVVHKGRWNLGRAGEPSDLDDEALTWTNALWTIGNPGDRAYPHVYPAELVERCLRLFSFPGALVADFHLGSGTTAVAALQTGRRFVGGDLNPTAVALASQRVHAAYVATAVE